MSDDNTWVTTWAQSMFRMPPAWANGGSIGPGVIEVSAHTGGGGDAARLTLSNRFGAEPVEVGRVECVGADGASAAFAFESQTSVTVPAYGEQVSDALRFALPSAGAVRIRLRLTKSLTLSTVNRLETDVWTFTDAAGDSAPVRPSLWFGGASQLSPLPLLARLEVRGAEAPLRLIGFGDSLTAGGWPAFLADAFESAAPSRSWGVANAGISGNRLLRPGAGAEGSWFGDAGIERFVRELPPESGRCQVVVLLGVNDLLQPGSVAPATEEVAPGDIISGYQHLLTLAAGRGATVRLCTLLPFEGAEGATPVREGVRQRINSWIRETHGYVDTDRGMADPNSMTRLRPDFDSGDHLHPNIAGQRELASIIRRSVRGLAP